MKASTTIYSSILSLLILAFFTSCELDKVDVSNLSELEEEEYTIQGRILDAATDMPVAGASVSVEGTEVATTDAEGYYSFTTGDALPESTLIVASKDDYVDGARYIYQGMLDWGSLVTVDVDFFLTEYTKEFFFSNQTQEINVNDSVNVEIPGKTYTAYTQDFQMTSVSPKQVAGDFGNLLHANDGDTVHLYTPLTVVDFTDNGNHGLKLYDFIEVYLTTALPIQAEDSIALFKLNQDTKVWEMEAKGTIADAQPVFLMDGQTMRFKVRTVDTWMLAVKSGACTVSDEIVTAPFLNDKQQNCDCGDPIVNELEFTWNEVDSVQGTVDYTLYQALGITAPVDLTSAGTNMQELVDLQANTEKTSVFLDKCTECNITASHIIRRVEGYRRTAANWTDKIDENYDFTIVHQFGVNLTTAHGNCSTNNKCHQGCD